MRTLRLVLLAALLGATLAFVVGFPLRFLWMSYSHAGLW